MKNFSDKIEKWFLQASTQVFPHKPVSIHMDELLGVHVNKEEYLSTSLGVFLILLEKIKSMDASFQLILGIPLISRRNKIKFLVPKDQSAMERDFTDTPPNIYLVSWETKKYLNIIEGYECPLPFNLFSPPLEGVYIRYSESRGEISIKNNFEFARNVSVEYFPEEFREVF